VIPWIGLLIAFWVIRRSIRLHDDQKLGPQDTAELKRLRRYRLLAGWLVMLLGGFGLMANVDGYARKYWIVPLVLGIAGMVGLVVTDVMIARSRRS
jgi:hypothetical protein